MSIETMPLERLEREITELASHIHAAMCRWLLLVGGVRPPRGLGTVGLQVVRALGVVDVWARSGRFARTRPGRAAVGGVAADHGVVLQG